MTIIVKMNGIELGRKFDTKEEAKKYVTTCKKIDKKHGSKNTYKIEVI